MDWWGGAGDGGQREGACLLSLTESTFDRAQYIYIYIYIYCVCVYIYCAHHIPRTRHGDAGVGAYGEGAAVGEGDEELREPQVLDRQQQPVLALEPDDGAAVLCLGLVLGWVGLGWVGKGRGVGMMIEREKGPTVSKPKYLHPLPLYHIHNINA